MAGWDVHRLAGGDLVVDCQSDVISGFGTRLVVPLVPPGSINRPLPRLMPLFRINGEALVLATPFAGAVPERSLSAPIASLAEHDHLVLGAIDLLLLGY